MQATFEALLKCDNFALGCGKEVWPEMAETDDGYNLLQSACKQFCDQELSLFIVQWSSAKGYRVQRKLKNRIDKSEERT